MISYEFGSSIHEFDVTSDDFELGPVHAYFFIRFFYLFFYQHILFYPFKFSIHT